MALNLRTWPDDLHKKLKTIADIKGSSFNQLMIDIAREYVEKNFKAVIMSALKNDKEDTWNLKP
jgi:hypothetical protein